MKQKWLKAKTGILLMAIAVTGIAIVFTACGGMQSDSVPSSSAKLSLKALSSRGTDSNNRTIVRANGADTIQIQADVQGLSSSVGFFTSSEWVTFQGGSYNSTDGYTYYTADRSGKAVATLVSSTRAGKTDVYAKSMDVTASLPLTFTPGTLAVYPALAYLPGVPNQDYVVLTAVGGELPISWTISHPLLLGYTKLSDTSIKVYVISNTYLTDTTPLPVYVTAIDAEGNTAQSEITVGDSSGTPCASAAVSLSPTSGPSGTSISVMVDDYDRRDKSSLTLNIKGANLTSASTVTVYPWATSGTFQGDYVLTCSGCASGDIFTFYYTEKSTQCQSDILSTDFTIGSASNSSCTDALITIPDGVSLSSTSVPVSVDDYDRRGAGSVLVTVTGPGGTGVITLTESSSTSGHFDGTVDLSYYATGCATGLSVTLMYSDIGADCQSRTETKQWDCA